MKDLIWTLILVWLAYKVVEIFQHASRSKIKNSPGAGRVESTVRENKRDLKSAARKRLNEEGEYVDFEEL